MSSTFLLRRPGNNNNIDHRTTTTTTTPIRNNINNVPYDIIKRVQVTVTRTLRLILTSARVVWNHANRTGVFVFICVFSFFFFLFSSPVYLHAAKRHDTRARPTVRFRKETFYTLVYKFHILCSSARRELVVPLLQQLVMRRGPR